MPAKIPATVITGFLGAGKTTLVRNLLQNAGGLRIALIINEFGDLGVDGDILKGCGDALCREEDMVELSNGCICCTVAEDFVPTIEALISRDAPPDHIVIETSGLALPQPLVRAFNWPEISTRVTVDGVIAVVDGPAVDAGTFAANLAAVEAQRAGDDALDHSTPLSELFEDQMAAADMIVINKTDLMADGAADALSSRLIPAARTGVQVIKASQGAVDPAILLGLGVGAEADMARREAPHHHHHDDDHHEDHDGDHDDHHHHDDHDHDAFESFVIDLPEQTDAGALLTQVRSAIADHGILRLKGFAAIAGKPMRQVIQAVGPRVDVHFDRPFAPGEARNTRLVVIGAAGLDRGAIIAALAPGQDKAA